MGGFRAVFRFWAALTLLLALGMTSATTALPRAEASFAVKDAGAWVEQVWHAQGSALHDGAEQEHSAGVMPPGPAALASPCGGGLRALPCLQISGVIRDGPRRPPRRPRV